MDLLLHILILEDRPEDAELVVHELQRAGFKPEWKRVENERDFLAELDKPYDLIIADYQLPDFDGFRALKLLEERGLKIPFILVSGTIGQELAIEAIKHGATDYLLKDRLTRLGQSVVRALEEQKLREEKRIADQALRDSEQRFRALIENSADAIALADANGKILYASPAAGRILGVPSETLIGKSTFAGIHPEDLARAKSDFEEVRQHPEMSKFSQFRFRHRDGSWRWIEGIGTNLLAEHGVRAMVANYRDITERKQVEDKLHLSDEILARVKSLVVVADSEGKILSVSPAVQEILGYTPDELLGEGWWEKTRPESADREREKNYVARAALGQEPIAPEPYERLLVARNAEKRWIVWQDAKGPGNTLIGMGHDITERKRAEQEIQRHLSHVQALHRIDKAISSNLDLRSTLETYLTHVTVQLGVDAADVLLLNSQTQTLDYAAGRGFKTSALQHTHLQLGDGLAGRAALERRLIAIDNLARDVNGLLRSPSLASEGFAVYYGVPLIAKGKVNGVLEIFHRVSIDANQEWIDFLETLAEQAAIAIDNAELFGNLQRTNLELGLAYDRTLEGWSRALDLRDHETEGHTQRVTKMVSRLAREMGMGEADLAHVRRGALLHDIGKMGVPDAILFKPDKLTDEEWRVMHKHPELALQMLAPIEYLKPALDIPYCHHEKWDGTGYPRALKGEQIPFAARIFAVVDVWDALRSDRPYRRAWSKEKALDYIREQVGKHFDPQTVGKFLGILEQEK